MNPNNLTRQKSDNEATPESIYERAIALRSSFQEAARDRQRVRMPEGSYRQLGQNIERGRSRDLLARRLGFGSGWQLEKLMTVFQLGSTELKEMVNQGDVSIHKAWRIVTGQIDE